MQDDVVQDIKNAIVTLGRFREATKDLDDDVSVGFLYREGLAEAKGNDFLFTPTAIWTPTGEEYEENPEVTLVSVIPPIPLAQYQLDGENIPVPPSNNTTIQ